MVDEGNGDGNGDGAYGGMSLTDNTQFMTRIECLQTQKRMDKRMEKTSIALFGEDGTGGMVYSLNELKIMLKIGIAVIVFVLPIISSIITALILKRIGI